MALGALGLEIDCFMEHSGRRFQRSSLNFEP
jgi:hypothetical protein